MASDLLLDARHELRIEDMRDPVGIRGGARDGAVVAVVLLVLVLVLILLVRGLLQAHELLSIFRELREYLGRAAEASYSFAAAGAGLGQGARDPEVRRPRDGLG